MTAQDRINQQAEAIPVWLQPILDQGVSISEKARPDALFALQWSGQFFDGQIMARRVNHWAEGQPPQILWFTGGGVYGSIYFVTAIASGMSRLLHEYVANLGAPEVDLARDLTTMTAEYCRVFCIYSKAIDLWLKREP